MMYDLSPCCPVQIYHLFLILSALMLYSEQIKMMMMMIGSRTFSIEHAISDDLE